MGVTELTGQVVGVSPQYYHFKKYHVSTNVYTYLPQRWGWSFGFLRLRPAPSIPVRGSLRISWLIGCKLVGECGNTALKRDVMVINTSSNSILRETELQNLCILPTKL